MLTNPLQYIDEIIVRIDVMQPTGHQQALHDTDVLGAEFGPTDNQFSPKTLLVVSRMGRFW